MKIGMRGGWRGTDGNSGEKRRRGERKWGEEGLVEDLEVGNGGPFRM